MIAVACVLLGLDANVDFHGLLEVGGIYSEVRANGGNEMSFGDYELGLELQISYAFVRAGVEYASSPLDFADVDEQNQHNQNWLRADGYVSRPWLVPWVEITWSTLHFRAGGLQAVGLCPLAPAGYYLLAPGSLLHSQHWDKGFALGVDDPWIRAEVSVVDGDWAIGQADVLVYSDSRANSTPSVAGKVELGPAVAHIGAQAIWGMTGSYPGEKRREDNVLVYGEIDLDTVKMRAHGVMLWRNPQGDGSGSHVPAVGTYGGGVEALWRLPGNVYIHGQFWGLWGNGYDGEVWVSEGLRRVVGVTGGLAWRPWMYLWVGAEGGALFFNQIYAGTDNPMLLVCYVRGEF